jgi:hypothetical protein
MRRIALDARRFEDDREFDTYADEHGLSVDEAVYYLNAYEAGGDEGLYALRAPGPIPPETMQRARRAIAAMLEERAPGMPYRILDEGTAIGVYEVRRRMSGEAHLFALFQLRLTRASMHWHLYWMRAFDAWWPYLPTEGRRPYSLKVRLQQVRDDEFGCFWG